MKNKLKVGKFVEIKIIKDGYSRREIVFLKERNKNSKVYTIEHPDYHGYFREKELKILSNKNKNIIKTRIKEAEAQKEFYEKTLEQIEKEK